MNVMEVGFRQGEERWLSPKEDNVIKIRKYIIPNRYDNLPICSFFVFKKKHLTNQQKNATKPFEYITF